MYKPTETHLALHPHRQMIKCKCGVKFAIREKSMHSEDNPRLCLSCNRKSWSKLCQGNKTVSSSSESGAEVIRMKRKETK